MIRRASFDDIADYLPYTVGETEEEMRYAMGRRYATWLRDGEAFFQVAGDPELRRVQLGPFYPEKGLARRRAQLIIKTGLAWFHEDWPDTADWYTFTLVDNAATARIFKGWFAGSESHPVGNGCTIVSLPTFTDVNERAQAWLVSP